MAETAQLPSGAIEGPTQRRWHITHGTQFVWRLTAPSASAAVIATRERWGAVDGFDATEVFPRCGGCGLEGPRGDLHLCGREGRTVALIACSASKLDRPAPARELYQGNLFKLARAWSEAHGLDWYVLSAKHRVVHPDQAIAPYDQRVPTQTELRSLWCHSVNYQTWRVAPHGRLILLCGADYAQAFDLSLRPFTVEKPLERLPLGMKMRWLRQGIAARRQPRLFAA